MLLEILNQVEQQQREDVLRRNNRQPQFELPWSDEAPRRVKPQKRISSPPIEVQTQPFQIIKISENPYTVKVIYGEISNEAPAEMANSTEADHSWITEITGDGSIYLSAEFDTSGQIVARNIAFGTRPADDQENRKYYLNLGMFYQDEETFQITFLQTNIGSKQLTDYRVWFSFNPIRFLPAWQ